MAISTEHLGAQVQCPHCRAVVQTPPASAFAAPMPAPEPAAPAPSSPPPLEPPPIHVPRHETGEDIFSEPPPSDDLFGQSAEPKVLMPEEAAPPPPAPQPVHTAPVPEPMPEPVHAAPPHESAHHAAEETEEPADLAAMHARVQAARKASSLAPMILVFLVPYAICCTAFIAYLLYNWPSIDRLDYLPDPKRDGVRRTVTLVPAHDSPLAAERKVPLKETVRVGDIEITPLRVLRVDGNLQLEFRARNASTNLTMTPIEPVFFKYDRKAAAGSVKPYTFLESPGQADRVYGGYVEYFQGDREHNGELHPGQEEIIRLTTEQGDRGRVNALLGTSGRLLWRLQVRRGLISYRGSMISATAVVGVEFGPQDVVKGEV